MSLSKMQSLLKMPMSMQTPLTPDTRLASSGNDPEVVNKFKRRY